jgi:hypothetical protein
MPGSPKALAALGFLQPPSAQGIVETRTQREARIFFGQRSQRAPQILELLGFRAAALARRQVSVELILAFEAPAPMIDKLQSGFFAVHDALSPANSP